MRTLLIAFVACVTLCGVANAGLPLPLPCLTPAQVTTAYVSNAPGSAGRASIRQYLNAGGLVCAPTSGPALATQLAVTYGY